jgi:hypothetical protein
MNTTQEQNAGNGKNAFGFERGDDWVHFSADLGQMCQDIGEQVRRAVAQIDFEGILNEVHRAVDDIAAEAREAADNFRNSPAWSGPTRVHVDIRAETPAQPRQPNLNAERKAVLDLLAQGKINAEEAARLLDALGG